MPRQDPYTGFHGFRDEAQPHIEGLLALEGLTESRQEDPGQRNLTYPYTAVVPVAGLKFTSRVVGRQPFFVSGT
jgi:hypothetical protein